VNPHRFATGRGRCHCSKKHIGADEVEGIEESYLVSKRPAHKFDPERPETEGEKMSAKGKDEPERFELPEIQDGGGINGKIQDSDQDHRRESERDI
jgi:hypothetical protein